MRRFGTGGGSDGCLPVDELTAVALTKMRCFSRSRDMVAAVSGEGRTRRGGSRGCLEDSQDGPISDCGMGFWASRRGAEAGAGAVYRGDKAKRGCENAVTAR